MTCFIAAVCRYNYYTTDIFWYKTTWQAPNIIKMAAHLWYIFVPYVSDFFSKNLFKAQSEEISISVTQLLIPTHAHFHWLKFIKNI